MAAVTPTAGAEPDTAPRCDAALIRAFDLLGKRWSGLILAALQSGPSGFAGLRRGVTGITDSMLSDRLSELTAAALVSRSVSDAKPPTVTYTLTPAGDALLPILDELAKWATEHVPERCRSATHG
jgi:DNA-binding HxlR family transcriptional regulator